MTGDVLEQEGGPTGATGGLSENTPGNPGQPLRGLAEAFAVLPEGCTRDCCMSFAAAVEMHAYTVRHKAELLALLEA